MMVSTRDVITSPPPPTPTELERIALGEQQVCSKLINAWETPVKVIASKYTSRVSDIDDLMQAGRLAVYKSALKYEASLGVRFANYTKRAIKYAIMRTAARLARQRRLETPLERHVTDAENPRDEITLRADQSHPINGWVRELPEPHATIFRLLYVEKMKQRPAAQEMGVSQPRVAQLHQSFLKLAWAAFIA